MFSIRCIIRESEEEIDFLFVIYVKEGKLTTCSVASVFAWLWLLESPEVVICPQCAVWSPKGGRDDSPVIGIRLF